MHFGVFPSLALTCASRVHIVRRALIIWKYNSARASYIQNSNIYYIKGDDCAHRKCMVYRGKNVNNKKKLKNIYIFFFFIKNKSKKRIFNSHNCITVYARDDETLSVGRKRRLKMLAPVQETSSSRSFSSFHFFLSFLFFSSEYTYIYTLFLWSRLSLYALAKTRVISALH